MELKEIAPGYFVSPQIAVEDVPQIVAAGITRVICNRPDEEVMADHQAQTIGAAVQAAGLDFATIPVTTDGMSMDDVAQHAELIAGASGAVLAYCRSGTRSTIMWALGQAGTLPTEEILFAAARQGYQLDGLRPTLDAIALRQG
ncbi:TIGR01244 family sulfur transferase [Salipiger sp.]|uniref:TIGR01244 family sulfur transferase n=1 Tax=Salipiger sp. TaxID=2078585 RepID=UPI003A96E227